MTSKSIFASALLGALCLGAAAVGPSVAFAADACPADKSGIDVRKPDASPAKDVTDTVIGSVDVSKEPAAIAGRLFRLRRLVIEPGGVVPWHSHADRPAIIYVVTGTVTEYASNCSDPLVHQMGDAIPETHLTSHWWKNTGKTTAILLSADLLPVNADPHMM